MQQPGTLIEGKYEIIGKLREGGMGAIYKVRHRLLDEIRVVKVMRPQILANEELKLRFAEEAKTATRLKHPNICTIHDFALDDDGTAYLVMEFIDGVTLADLSRSPSPVGLAMTLEIASQSLLALAYLHRRNVVHRDIAPDNLMLTSDEEGLPLVKLIDLGIAKAIDKTGGGMTSTGVFLGKLKYASPEQYGALPPGEKIDGRSDLYCLGVVMYEMLTGTRPFEGESPPELLRAHLFQPPLPFSQTDPQGLVPPEVRAAILKSLEKKREDRFATAEEFHREIVRLKTHVPGASDAESTVAFVSNVRLTRHVSGSGITPSAQDRLDRQFGPQSTPHPASTPLSLAPDGATIDKTTTMTPKPIPRDRFSSELTVVPARARRKISRFVVPAFAAVAAAAAVLMIRDTGRQSAPSASSAPPAAAAVPAARETATSVGSVAASRPEAPTPAAPAAASAAPVEPPPPRATLSAETSAPPRAKEAEASRAREAPRVRPTAEPARKRPSPAPPADRRPAETLAQSRLPGAKPTPAAAASVPAPIAAAVIPTAVTAPAAPPTAVLRAAVAPAPAADTKPAPPSDSDRIRDVLRRYEKAQNTLDADLYSRVYPSADRSRVQTAFDNFRSQSVAFDQIRIDVAPGATRATVRLHERRVAVPKVGSEQHADGNRRVLLQKEGDSWVITGLQ